MDHGAASHEIMSTHNPLIVSPGLLTKKLDELVLPAVVLMYNEPAFGGRACSDMREHDELRRRYCSRRKVRERMAALYQNRKKIASTLHVSES